MTDNLARNYAEAVAATISEMWQEGDFDAIHEYPLEIRNSDDGMVAVITAGGPHAELWEDGDVHVWWDRKHEITRNADTIALAEYYGELA